MDAEIKKREACLYKTKDSNYEHVFHYYDIEELLCDNKECENREQNVEYLVEGEGKAVGICRTDGFVDSENSELIKKIKESSFFKTLEEEKLKEAREDAVIAAIANFGSD